MGSLPNMDVCDDNIVYGKRTRSRTNRFVHPDEMETCRAYYEDEELDEAAEIAGEVFVPINENCVESGEEAKEEAGEIAEEEFFTRVSDGAIPNGEPDELYVPSEEDIGSGSESESESESGSESESDFSD